MSTFRDMSVGDIAVVTNVSGSGQLRKRSAVSMVSLPSCWTWRKST